MITIGAGGGTSLAADSGLAGASPEQTSDLLVVQGQEPGQKQEPTQGEAYDPFAKQGEALSEEEDYDPWEAYNTAVFNFNRKLDQYLVKPVAKGYNAVVPDSVQHGISNVFFNIRFVPRMFNNLFQGKVKGAGIELSRFLINSTAGLAGFFEPYLLIPLWPVPFTIRDGAGFIVDLALDPFNWLVLPFFPIEGAPILVENVDTAFYANLATRAFYILNERSLSLETFEGVEEATLDLYSAVRNAYLQRRARAIQE